MKAPYDSELEKKLDNCIKSPEETAEINRAIKEKDYTPYVTRSFPFVCMKQLYETLTALYPELNQVVVCNADDRDAEGNPFMQSKKLRPLTIRCKAHQSIWGDIQHSSDVKFKIAVCLISQHSVYAKIAYTTKHEWER